MARVIKELHWKSFFLIFFYFSCVSTFILAGFYIFLFPRSYITTYLTFARLPYPSCTAATDVTYHCIAFADGPGKLQKICAGTDGPKLLLIPRCIYKSNILKGAAHLWGLFFHHFFSFRNFYFIISSFLHYVVWLLKYKRKFFWKILVTPRWVMSSRMVNNFFLVGTISHVWMIGNSKSIFMLKEGINGYYP